MRKLRLQLEDLQIDSFSTTPVQKKDKGTVFGEQCTCPTACTCPGCPTCDPSCNGTCGASCGATCDFSCDGTCDELCIPEFSVGGGRTCGYTCEGYQTNGGNHYDCVLC